MFDLVRKRPLKPYLEVERPHCPFYGFNEMNLEMIDTGGNDCAFKPYKPCQMEMAGDTPTWNKCPLNTEENQKRLEELAEAGMKVFPSEFKSPTAKNKEISLKNWMNYILE